MIKIPKDLKAGFAEACRAAGVTQEQGVEAALRAWVSELAGPTVTKRDIAKEAGVSEMAVYYSLALDSGQVSEATRKKVRAIARRMNYSHPIASARAMRRRLTEKLGQIEGNSARPRNRKKSPA